MPPLEQQQDACLLSLGKMSKVRSRSMGVRPLSPQMQLNIACHASADELKKYGPHTIAGAWLGTAGLLTQNSWSLGVSLMETEASRHLQTRCKGKGQNFRVHTLWGKLIGAHEDRVALGEKPCRTCARTRLQ